MDATSFLFFRNAASVGATAEAALFYPWLAAQIANPAAARHNPENNAT